MTFDAQPRAPDAIILAAGSSTRLGEPKQLVRFHGETLIHRAVRIALSVPVHAVYVVNAESHHEFKRALAAFEESRAVHLVRNATPQEGMGRSIALGMQALPGDNRAVLLLTCDQPLLQTAHLRALWQARPDSEQGIAASLYGGKLGIPVVFGPAHRPVLSALKGPQGAKKMLNRFAERAASQCIGVPFPEGAFDVDTREDLARLRKYEAKSQA